MSRMIYISGGAITLNVDATYNGVAAGSTNPHTISSVTSNGPDIYFVATTDVTGGQQLTGVTIDGNAMALVSRSSLIDGSRGYVEIWHYSGAFSAVNIVATAAGSFRLVASVYSCANVNAPTTTLDTDVQDSASATSLSMTGLNNPGDGAVTFLGSMFNNLGSISWSNVTAEDIESAVLRDHSIAHVLGSHAGTISVSTDAAAEACGAFGITIR